MSKQQEEQPKNISHHIKRTSEWIAGIYGSIAIIVSVSIGGYAAYNSILDSIDNNTKSIEVTQMMILKSMVRTIENNPCKMSDSAWDSYIENYAMLHDLKIKYKKISAKAPWQPIERLKEDSPQCKK